VIGKVCRRGTDVRRLLGYLFLEGQAGERGLASDHSDAHLVAGYAHLTSLEPDRGPDGRADVRRLAALLQAPVLAGNVTRDTKPVYHLAISAAKTDRQLSDVEWADIAAEYVHRLGLAPRGDDQAVRWVAVRHARDHVHVVATLVRQDGRRVFPRQDYLRSREASRTIEARYGLTTTAPVGGTSTPETTRAERRKHQQEIQRRRQQGRPDPAGPDRELLRARVRDALAATDSWDEFADWLSRDGVLVRPRMSTTHPDEITGYAVALRPTGFDIDRTPVWFSGGKLAPDLTLPRLQQRWATTTRAGGSSIRDAAGPAARRAAQAVAAAERDLGATATQVGPGPAADTAAAASDVLHAVSRLLEWKRPGPLRQAAEDYDRATRPARRSRAPSTPADEPCASQPVGSPWPGSAQGPTSRLSSSSSNNSPRSPTPSRPSARHRTSGPGRPPPAPRPSPSTRRRPTTAPWRSGHPGPRHVSGRQLRPTRWSRRRSPRRRLGDCRDDRQVGPDGAP
jgi:hypothetical protein